MPVLNVEKPLRDKLGEHATNSLVNMINESQAEQKNNILEFVEEKFERRLSEEISGLRVELTGEMSNLRTDLRAEIVERTSSLKAELTAQIANSKAELIKWMFIFWIGQVAMILGILFTFFKK